MDIPMKTIVEAIHNNIDVIPEMIERAIEEGYAERVEYVVLNADGQALLDESE